MKNEKMKVNAKDLRVSSMYENRGKLEGNLKCSGGAITIILIVLEVSIVIGICISLAFTIWVLNGTNGIPASNMLYQALLQGLRVQSNGEIAAELCTNAVSSLFLLFMLITAYPIFRSIRSGASPFSTQSAKRLKKVAIMGFVYAIVFDYGAGLQRQSDEALQGTVISNEVRE